MVDNFALALTHGLLALAAWRLIMRADLDRDPGEDEPMSGAISSRRKSGAPQNAAGDKRHAGQQPRA